MEEILSRFIEKDPKHYFPIDKSPNQFWIFKGSQAGNKGAVEREHVLKVYNKINSLKPAQILFNQDKIVPALEGGTCSAMSLEFIKTYFDSRKIVIKNEGEITTLLSLIQWSARNLRTSNEEMRIRQAAYNTIEVIKDLENEVDYSLQKIQSLANHHGFKIEIASDEIDILNIGSIAKGINTINNLDDGVYLTRILRPPDPQDLYEMAKFEKYGHSVVYIKDKGAELFYDPNKGLLNIKPGKSDLELMTQFKNLYNEHEVSTARFYKVADM
ncbi:MAG: hypothetical protein H0U49_12520 [Parachlamydiaceae bacterium]|nr:hypothetical protein [Parachlamydiaceae bacterium]